MMYFLLIAIIILGIGLIKNGNVVKSGMVPSFRYVVTHETKGKTLSHPQSVNVSREGAKLLYCPCPRGSLYERRHSSTGCP